MVFGGAILCAGPLPALAAASDEASAKLTEAARRVEERLDASQRSEAVYGFDDDERFDLRLAPFLLDGVALLDLDPEQRAGVRELLAAGLSAEGLAKVETIRSLENEVARIDRERGWWTRFVPIRRDPDAYYLTLYGEPAPTAPWGFRFDGHHVSLNFTVVPGGASSSTPLFLGGQPRIVREGWERAGLQVLAREENAARELLLSLDPAQRERATLPFEPDRGLFLGEGERLELEGPPRGVVRTDLSPPQQALLDELIEVYVTNLAPPIAAARRAAMEAAGRDAIHFAWAGSAEPGEPHYYRVRGPGFLIEFDNSQEDADHIHAIWREGEGDFGRDLLREHYAREH